MKENTNKAIAVNTIIMYIRLVVMVITSLLTTRFALKALGVNDFGLFSVVGSVITFIGFINTVMISTSNRFMAVAIGKDDIVEANKTFNVNLLIHFLIAVFALIISYPLGDCYIYNFVNYSGDIRTAVAVYNITVIGSIISFVGVPYNGLLMAKEKFVIFCVTDIITHFVKLFVAFSLIYYFSDKLSIYAMTIAATTGVHALVFAMYCHSKFSDICRLGFVKEKKRYKDVLSFSVWVGYGAIAYVGKSQGSALLINAFFNTVMNTALGIANNINAMLLMFANNVGKSMSPQIVKNYTSGNYERVEKLIVLSSKSSFFIMLLISCPFFITPEFVYGLWLGDIPDYVIAFTVLIIIDAIISTLNVGLTDLVFATGNIKRYQIIINTVLLSSIFVAYLVLKAGMPSYSLLCVYIVFTILTVIIRQFMLEKTVVNMNCRIMIPRVYLPAFLVTIIWSLSLFLKLYVSPILLLIISVVYLIILIWKFGFTKEERTQIIAIVHKFKSKLS